MLKPEVGERVASRYLLEREIAKGGMGAVWAGRDIKLKRTVAIKLLKPAREISDDARMRFEREATAVAQLQCPNVVQIFDYGVDREVPFIVMELLDGEDLHHRLKRVRRLPIEDMARILWQTAKALGVAHGAGVVHRDLKPANIFLVRMGEDEIAKVLDFGVAKATEDEEEDDEHATRDGTILGTPQFMSPEQARGLVGSIDHRSDLWSLGVITYRALTGSLPFKGRTAADAIVAIITSPFTPASEAAPDLPPEVDAFFAKALSKDPSRRFNSAREMALAFGNISPMSMPSLRLPEPALREIARKAEEAEQHLRRPGALPIPRKGRPLPPRKLPSGPETGPGSNRLGGPSTGPSVDPLSSSGVDFSADSSPSASGRVPIPDVGVLSARARQAASDSSEPSASSSGLDLAWPTSASGSGSLHDLGLLTPPADSTPASIMSDTMRSQLETGSSQASLRGVLIESDPGAARRKHRGRTIAIVAAVALLGAAGAVVSTGVLGNASGQPRADAPAAAQVAPAPTGDAPRADKPADEPTEDASQTQDDEAATDSAGDDAATEEDEPAASATAKRVPAGVPRPRQTATQPPQTATPPPPPPPTTNTKPADPFAERL